MKFYPQDERPTLVARRATLSESEAFRNEGRSAEKKGWIKFILFVQIIPQGGLPREDVTNRPVQNSKTACVILICFFNKMVFRAVWSSSSRVTWICCLISEKCIVRIRQNLVRSFVIDCFMVLTTVLRNIKTKRAGNLVKPGKQRGCHNCYRQGVLSLYRIMSTKPFPIALFQ